MSESEKIQKFFRSYLTEHTIKQDFAERIIKYADQYEAKDQNKDFLNRFYDSLKKCYDGKNPKNFVTACQRFFFIINKLLAGKGKKEKRNKYCEFISQQIVQYYLFIFQILQKHHLHDFTTKLKMYRLKWAKIITDKAFVKMKQAIFNKFRQFNLDKLSLQNLEQIKANHKKRGLSQQQSNFYLGLTQKQQTKTRTPQTQKMGQQSVSSDSESQNEHSPSPHKKVKINQTPKSNNSMLEPRNFNYNVIQSHPAMSIQKDYPFKQNYNLNIYDPRLNRSSYQQNTYNTINDSLINRNYIPVDVDFREDHLKPQYINQYQMDPIPPHQYFTQPMYQLTGQDGNSVEVLSSAQSNPQKKNHFSVQKIKKIRQQIQQSPYRCRQCGQSFQTSQNHQKHMTEHFFQSLDKVNEAQFKGKAIKKESKIKLFDIKSWECVDQSTEKQYQFEVLLSEVSDLKGQDAHCFFCNQKLEVTFSEKYQNWVFADAVKINDQNRVNIMHFDCYQSFKSDQNSPVSS